METMSLDARPGRQVDSAEGNTSSGLRRALASDNALLIAIALASFLGHMLVSGNYGYFRDELYYIAAGHHLAAGYVDFPLLIALLAALLQPFGDNLVIIHIVPALANACLIFLTGLLAREFGGGRLAQVTAALTAAVCIAFMATGSIFSMDALDQLWWALAAYVLVLLIKREEPQLWLVFGLVAGIGLTTKLTMLFWGLALVLGLLLTSNRKLLWNRWVPAGGAASLLFLLPYTLWNIANGLPTWEFWHNYGGITGDGPIAYLVNQIFLINPVTVPVAILGLIFFFRGSAGKPYRAFGWAFVFLYVLFTLVHTKSYFLAPAYPPLFAGGALLIERAAESRRGRPLLAPLILVVLALSGILFAPLAMPVLPPGTFVHDYGFLTGQGNASAGQANQGAFPQYLGDRFGWTRMAAAVARVYQSLPAREQSQACIFTSNYGEAGALQLYGDQYHLPPVISGHNSYYLWGPGSCSGAVMITVGISPSDLAKSYQSVLLATTMTCTYCMPGENDLLIYVVRLPRYSTHQVWSSVKHYN
jgi:4-amino-4-deoxy-L-arabinose transferase-like glycosyltransferase